MATALNLDAPLPSRPNSTADSKAALTIVHAESAQDSESTQSAHQRTSAAPRLVEAAAALNSGDLTADLDQLTALLQSLLSEGISTQNKTSPELNQTALNLLNQLEELAPPSDPNNPLNGTYQTVKALVAQLQQTFSASSSAPIKDSAGSLLQTAQTLLGQLAKSAPSATAPEASMPSSGSSGSNDTLAALVQLTIIMIGLEIAINAFMAKNAQNETDMSKNEMVAMKAQQADTKAQIDAMEEQKKEQSIWGWLMVAIQIVVAIVMAPIDPVGSALMLSMAGMQIAQMQGAIPENWTGNAIGDIFLKLAITIIVSVASFGTATPEMAAAESASVAAKAAAEAAAEAATAASTAAAKAIAESVEKAALAAAENATPEVALAAEAAEAAAQKAISFSQKAASVSEKASEAAAKASEAVEKVANVSKVAEEAGKASKEFKEAVTEAQTALKDAAKAAEDAAKAAKEAGMGGKEAQNASAAAEKAVPAEKKIPLDFTRFSVGFSTLNPLGSIAQLSGDDKIKEILSIVCQVITAILALLAAYKGGKEMADGLVKPNSLLAKLDLTPTMQEMLTQIMLKTTSAMDLASGGFGVASGVTKMKMADIQEAMAAPLKAYTILVLLAKMWQGQMKETSNWQQGENDDFAQWNSLFGQLTQGEAAATDALRAYRA